MLITHSQASDPSLLLARYISDALLLEKYTFICIFQIFSAVLSLYVGRKEGMRLDMKCITTVKTCLALSSTNPSMQSRMTSVFRKKETFLCLCWNQSQKITEWIWFLKKRCSIQELMEIVLSLVPTVIVWHYDDWHHWVWLFSLCILSGSTA